MSDLELEKQEIERLEQELELKKQQMEFKRQELMQQELYAQQNQPVVPEYQYEVEGVDNEVEDTNNQMSENKVLENRRKLFKFCAIVVFMFIMVCAFIDNSKREEYYDSIPLIIENPEEYYDMTYEDIVEIYGEPNEVGNFDYDMGEYELRFIFKHGYVSIISYNRKGENFFENPKDGLYVFGLEDKADLFRNGDGFNKNIYRCSDTSYPIDAYGYDGINYSNNWEESVIIYFQEHYSDREVFEDDFSDTPVIYDLVQYLGMNQMSVYSLLGKCSEVGDLGEWTYYSKLGKLIIYFDNSNKVKLVTFNANDPMKYEKSTQEAMVMFGVKPNATGIRLYEYPYKGGNFYNETYENTNLDWGSFSIRGIDLKEKTFKNVAINNMRKQ